MTKLIPALAYGLLLSLSLSGKIAQHMRVEGHDRDRRVGPLGQTHLDLDALLQTDGADAEDALRGTNAKFEKRFAYIEKKLAERGLALKEAGLDEMDRLWNEAKTKA